MKTTITNKNASLKKSFLVFGFLFALTIITSPLYAQTNNITVKGVVTSDDGPLDGVSIYLKNSTQGTITKSDGSFKFPSPLKVGDVLVFSYLGFDKVSVTIDEKSTDLKIEMKEVSIDVLSAPNSSKRFKSKRH